MTDTFPFKQDLIRDKKDICKILATAFRSPEAHSIAGFPNPVNEIGPKYNSPVVETDLNGAVGRK